MVDLDIHSMAVAGKIRNRTATADFKTQVQQFLAYEKESYSVSQRFHTGDHWTIFTVFFGLWEILSFSTLEKDFAILAIDNSVAELFRQLDLLAAHALTPIKIIVPRMVDITFLSRFKEIENDEGGQYARAQHQRVFLMTYWNAILHRGAMQWQKGDIFMPDSNAVFMEQVREKQLHFAQPSDASGSGRSMPLSEYVEQPCLTMLSDDRTPNPQADVGKCSDPTLHLFWSVYRRTNTLSSSNQAIGTTCILELRPTS
jgi:hypothetical protein